MAKSNSANPVLAYHVLTTQIEHQGFLLVFFRSDRLIACSGGAPSPATVKKPKASESHPCLKTSLILCGRYPGMAQAIASFRHFHLNRGRISALISAGLARQTAEHFVERLAFEIVLPISSRRQTCPRRIVFTVMVSSGYEWPV